jgi:5-formyltetrahydrofolate cyclo-ligase
MVVVFKITAEINLNVIVFIMKVELRKTLLQQRARLTSDQINAFSMQLCGRLFTLLQSLPACTIGIYYPLKGEPDVLPLCANPLLEGRSWGLPVCNSTESEQFLLFRHYTAGDALVVGQYQIPVPKNELLMTPSCLLIPCVGFSRLGARIGYGAGWYDKTLARMTPKPLTIGLAFSYSEVKQVFQAPHDVLLDYIVTELEVIAVSPFAQAHSK